MKDDAICPWKSQAICVKKAGPCHIPSCLSYSFLVDDRPEMLCPEEAIGHEQYINHVLTDKLVKTPCRGAGILLTSLIEDEDGLPVAISGTGLRKSAIKAWQRRFVGPLLTEETCEPSSSQTKVFVLFPFKSGEGDEDFTSALNMPGGQAGIYLQKAASGSL